MSTPTDAQVSIRKDATMPDPLRSAPMLAKATRMQYGVDFASEDRSALIEKIVKAAEKPIFPIVEKVEMEGDDGKWHSPMGFPAGVRPTGNKRVVGYAFRNPRSGTTVGTTRKTKEELINEHAEREKRNADNFRRELESMSPERIQSQAEYWLK